MLSEKLLLFIGKFLSLHGDPQPGLSTWHEARARLAQQIIDELAKLI